MNKLFIVLLFPLSACTTVVNNELGEPYEPALCETVDTTYSTTIVSDGVIDPKTEVTQACSPKIYDPLSDKEKEMRKVRKRNHG